MPNSPTAALVSAISSDAFSGVIHVEVDGEVLVDEAAGQTRFEAGNAINRSTRFATASISKMFTAACVARLAERGELNLDDAVIKHLPDHTDWLDGDVTLDALLTHRSGLGDYIDDDAELPFEALPVAELTTVSSFLSMVRQVDRFEPGTFRYSSAGFILLGLVVERVVGMSFIDAVSELVLSPAELDATDFCRVDDDDTQFAWGYLKDGCVNHAQVPHCGGPDGGIVTTVDDLQSFFRWLKSDTFASQQVRDRLWEPVSVVERDDCFYGRGFDVLKRGGRRWIGHTGSDAGVSARAVVDVDSESTIIVLCNRQSIAFRVFRKAMDAVEARILESR